MALSPEDRKDVKNAYGKAIAKKISKVTNDYGGAKHNREAQKRRDADPAGFALREKRMHAENDYKSGNYVTLKPTSSRSESIGKGTTTAFSPYRPGKSDPQKYTDVSKKDTRSYDALKQWKETGKKPRGLRQVL